MRSTSSFYWPKQELSNQSSAYQSQSRQSSSAKSQSLLSDSKVSPRVHILIDPQRPNLPMQVYQRFELRIPNSLNTTILPKDDAKDSAQTLRNAISAMASPTYRNTNHHHGQFSQKILRPNLTPKRSRPATQYNSLKTLSKSSEKGRKTIVTENNKLLKESNEVLQRQRGISQENFCRSPVPKLDFKERLSPEVSPYNNFKNARTHLLEEPQLPKNSSQQLLEKNNHWNQHSIFQTSRSIIPQNPVYCERYENYGGFTTFRRELWPQNTINDQEIARKSPQMMDQIDETNWQTKATCSRRLSFEGNEKTQPIDYLRIKRVEDKLHQNLENENNKVLGKDSSRGCSQAETRKSSRASLAFENNASQREKVILENRGIKELKINPFNENESTTKESVLIFSSGFASPCGAEVFEIKDKNKKGDPEEEEIKLRKMMMELKQKIIEKDMEIFEWKNGKKKDEIETKALKSKLNQVSTAKKQSEDCLEQAMQHVASQEREINFLNKCKERLESVLPEQEDQCDSDIKAFLQKIQEYEGVLEGKENETKETNLRIKQIEEQSERELEVEKSKGKAEIRRLDLEVRVRDQEIKQLNEMIQPLKERQNQYENVEDKLIKMEQTQNKLIEENINLKNKLSPSERKIFEKENQNRAIASNISQTSKEINIVNDYAKVLINIFETTLKGKGFSHEVKKQLEYLKWIQTDIKTKEIIQADTISQVKLLAKKNLVSAENLNEKFIGSMDEMCEKYARVYGSNCNLQ